MTSHKKAMDDNEKLLLDLKKANNQLRVSSWVQIKKDLGHKIVNIFLSLGLNICCGCSKEPSH